jgi:hypothetical protein
VQRLVTLLKCWCYVSSKGFGAACCACCALRHLGWVDGPLQLMQGSMGLVHLIR